jgi:glutamate formiminotransferase/formiminotetrahydrofolate cyclodeaminase
MEKSLEAMELVKDMAEKGNPNSVSDAGVGALCLRTAVEGAWLNVKINAQGNDHLSEIPVLLKRAQEVAVIARKKEATIMKIVDEKIES